MFYRLTNEINTTITGLSEGVFWDFKNQSTANFFIRLLWYFRR